MQILQEEVFAKFGNDRFIVDRDTFIMGVHYQFGESIARRFSGYCSVLDTCSGAGFMAIALSKYVRKVVTVNINCSHLMMSQKNAKIAGLSEKINFLKGDILKILAQDQLPKVDAAFLDPDWTPINEANKKIHTSSLSEMQPDGSKLLSAVLNLTSNVCFRLPREFLFSDLSSYPEHEIEEFKQEEKVKFYCAWFGDLRKQ